MKKTINLGGSMNGVFKKLPNGRWSLENGLFNEWVAKKVIKEHDPKHNINKKAKIGITPRGYELFPYFSEMAQGGYKPIQYMEISNNLFNDLLETFKEYN